MKKLTFLPLLVLCFSFPAFARLPDQTVKAQVAEGNDVNSCAAWLVVDGMRWASRKDKANGAQYILCNCQKALQGKGAPPNPNKLMDLGVSTEKCTQTAKNKGSVQMAAGGFEISTPEGPAMVIPFEGGLGMGQKGGSVGAVMDILKKCPECTWRVTGHDGNIN